MKFIVTKRTENSKIPAWLTNKKLLALYFICIVVFYFTVIKRFKENDDSISVFLKYANKKYQKTNDICELPELKLEGHKSVYAAKKCRLEYDWGYLNNTKWYLTHEAKTQLKSIKCKYRYIEREDDFRLISSDYIAINEYDKIPHELIEVKCDGLNKYDQNKQIDMLLAQIIPQKIPTVSHHKHKCTPLSVILLSYDSVSRISWLMRLNKTTQFMVNKMGFEILEGFNIIGDGTPATLTPVLTGKMEYELPSVLKTNPNDKYVDEVYNFIWRELKKKGYATFFNEDWPHYGTWTHRLKGMKDKVTTHYLRSYQIRLWERVQADYFNGFDDLCIGAKKRHQNNLDLLTQYYEAYKKDNIRIFAFNHYVENSHDGNQRLNLIDEELMEHLKYNYYAGNFDNTAIIMYSDHGDRFNVDRQAPQGYLEERLPFLAVYLPKSYRDDYPQKYENLKSNKKSLLSPYDIYVTIRDLTCLYDRSQLRSMSILNKLPNRQCQSIGIRDHYCACIKWTKLSNENKWSQTVTAYSIKYINGLINKHSECAN